MIQRIVLIKLTPAFATDEGRAEVARSAIATLSQIPQVKGVESGVPADEASARSWDVSIALRFDAAEDVEPYKSHPIHRRWVDEWLAPRREVLKAWSFALQG